MALDIVNPNKTENPGKVTLAEEKAQEEVEREEDLAAEYLDERNITIMPVDSVSLYRKANKTAIGSRRNVIGSSIRSTQILSSNAGEIKAYYPSIVGVDPTNPEFMIRVKAYLSNIQLIINDMGTTLNCSFRYNHKSDYLKFKAEEDAINAARESVNRGDSTAYKDAVKLWCTKINELESRKYAVGYPVNISDYLMYRHCLLYPEVTWDPIFAASDVSIRFYIRDEVREVERAKKLVEARKRALRNFVDVDADASKRNAVYIQIALANNENLSAALIRSEAEKTTVMMDFVNNNPEKFNKFASDRNIVLKGFIETLILRGELIRSEHNQQISTPDGGFIGENMNAAIAYFNNPNNIGQLEMYKKKFNLF